MCEFEVILDGKTVCKDIVYAKSEGNKVLVKDILGASKVFENCSIIEVNVGSEKLLLASNKP